MRAFSCDRCGQLLFFENSLCLRCGSEQGFAPAQLDLIVLAPSEGRGRPRCANAELAACNWLLEDAHAEGLCRSCRLTRTRPADADGQGLEQFQAAEAAKRRLVYQLLDLDLPIGDDLAFDLLSSQNGPVTTGHADGVITLDLAESDDVRREERRLQLGEPYRTLLGHFRHEIGHYLWPPLVEQTGRLDEYRALFGDEREDYGEALQRHYDHGPPARWAESYVSAYATMHPWEDWAETVAHYLHICDTLETAIAFGVAVVGPRAPVDPSVIALPEPRVLEGGFGPILDTWLPLTYALNAVNRSMGAPDLYPFTLSDVVVEKLRFVHDCVGALHQAN